MERVHDDHVRALGDELPDPGDHLGAEQGRAHHRQRAGPHRGQAGEGAERARVPGRAGQRIGEHPQLTGAGAGRHRAYQPPDVEQRDPVADAEIVARHGGRGPDRHVQAGGRVLAGPGGGGDVSGGVGDDEDLGVLLGEGRIGVQLPGATRDPPVDPVQSVPGPEGAHLRQRGAVAAAPREVRTAHPDRGGNVHRGIEHHGGGDHLERHRGQVYLRPEGAERIRDQHVHRPHLDPAPAPGADAQRRPAVAGEGAVARGEIRMRRPRDVRRGQQARACGHRGARRTVLVDPPTVQVQGRGGVGALLAACRAAGDGQQRPGQQGQPGEDQRRLSAQQRQGQGEHAHRGGADERGGGTGAEQGCGRLRATRRARGPCCSLSTRRTGGRPRRPCPRLSRVSCRSFGPQCPRGPFRCAVSRGRSHDGDRTGCGEATGTGTCSRTASTTPAPVAFCSHSSGRTVTRWSSAGCASSLTSSGTT